MITSVVEGRVLAASRETARALGWEQEDFVGRTVADLDLWPQPERRAVLLERLGREGEVYQSRETIKTRSGELLDVLASLEPIELDGQPCVIAMFYDIADRVPAEQALKDSEARLRGIVEHAPMLLIATDLDGRVTLATRQSERNYGAPLVGRTPDQLLEPAARERSASMRRRLLETGGPLLSEEEIAGADRVKRMYATTRFVLRDADGAAAGTGFIGIDITERKAVEAALHASEERFRLLIGSIADYAIVMLDPDGNVTGWNTGAQRIIGYTADEIVGRHVSAFYPPEVANAGHPGRELEAALSAGHYHEEGERVRKDGSRFWARVTLAPVRDADANLRGYAMVSHDISERRLAQAALSAAHDAALEASRLKSEFLARMSHEIRTPMNGVIGMASLLLDGELDPEQREFARTIQTSAEALRAVIDDILDFSKIEAGRLELEEIDFDLGELVEEVCVLLAGAAHAKGIELVVALEPELPAVLRGDPARTRQVLTNIVGNAVKFTNEGEVVVSVGAVDEEGERVLLRIEVRDTGIGIPFHAQPRLFESFTQAEVSTTRRYGGTGLGLTISQRLVTMMGGEIGFDSAPGVGSTFWFTLSLMRGRRSAAPRQTWLEGRLVLVVDDLPTNRAILERQLGHWGMSVVVADGGDAALRLAEDAIAAGRPFEVLVTDLHMPGMDGVELANALSRLQPASPVIVLSSGGGSESVRDRLTHNLSAFLMKPPRRSQLQDALAAALGAASVAEDVRAGPADEAPRRGSVLLVDDIAVNRQVARSMLTRFGYAVEEAVNGEEALVALTRRRFDAVLMDCEMPVLDGYAAAAEIRRREGDGARTPIIALTASAMKGDEQRALAAGMDLHVPKPIAIEQLLSALDGVMADAPVPADAAPDARQAEAVLDAERVERLRQLYPDPDELRAFIDVFLDDTRARMDVLGSAARDGDADAVWQAAHALQGACGIVGAPGLVALLVTIQTRARGGEVPDARSLAEIRAPFAEAREALSALATPPDANAA